MEWQENFFEVLCTVSFYKLSVTMQWPMAVNSAAYLCDRMTSLFYYVLTVMVAMFGTPKLKNVILYWIVVRSVTGIH